MRRARFRSGRRGFTLIELLVAMVAGLAVAVAALGLAKSASRFFASEARISNTQYATLVGFDRMRYDIARGGYLGTPHIYGDPLVCGTPSGAWPLGLQQMAAMRLEPAAAYGYPVDIVNNLAPDRLTLGGSYSTIESFPVRAAVSAGGTIAVTLQANTGPWQREMARWGNIGANLGPNVFKQGRAVRIVDGQGRHNWAVIKSYTYNGVEGTVNVDSANPPVKWRGVAGNTCGLDGFCVGCQLSVVSIVRYEIRAMPTGPNGEYLPLQAPEAKGPGDDVAKGERRELVRYEVDVFGTLMPGSEEVVAEYAVDLRFGLTIVNLPPSSPQMPNLVQASMRSFPIGDPQNYQFGNFDFTPATPQLSGPDRIRSVRVRLSTRSREYDLESGGVECAPVPGYRYRGMVNGILRCARMRSLTADVTLLSETELRW